MAKEFLTDLEVEKEIARLRESELVKLAKKEQRLKYRRRQILWSLRTLEKRGKELAEAGITEANLEAMISAAEADINEQERN